MLKFMLFADVERQNHPLNVAEYFVVNY